MEASLLYHGGGAFDNSTNVDVRCGQKALLPPLKPGGRKQRGGTAYAFSASGFASPSGKMILLTKKKTTMETPPLRTVVPHLFSRRGDDPPGRNGEG